MFFWMNRRKKLKMNILWFSNNLDLTVTFQLWLTPFFPQINVRTNPIIYHNFVLLFSQIFWCNGVGRFHTFEMIYTITVLLLEDAAVNSCLPPMSQLFYVIDDPFTHKKDHSETIFENVSTCITTKNLSKDKLKMASFWLDVIWILIMHIFKFEGTWCWCGGHFFDNIKILFWKSENTLTASKLFHISGSTLPFGGACLAHSWYLALVGITFNNNNLT